MVDERVVEWLKRQLLKGKSANDLTKLLVERGFKPEPIADALKIAQDQISSSGTIQSQNTASLSVHKEPVSHHLHTANALGILAVSLAVVALFLLFAGTGFQTDALDMEPTAYLLSDNIVSCQSSTACFLNHLRTCTPATLIERTPSCTVVSTILQSDSGRCIVEHRAEKCRVDSYVGERMVCTYPLDEAYPSIKGSSRYCVGSLVSRNLF